MAINNIYNIIEYQFGLFAIPNLEYKYCQYSNIFITKNKLFKYYQKEKYYLFAKLKSDIKSFKKGNIEVLQILININKALNRFIIKSIILLFK